MIEQAVILAKGQTIDRLPIPTQNNSPASAGVSPVTRQDLTRMTLKEHTSHILKESEAVYFDALLTEHKGHISRTAKAAGIDRTTFYRKIKQCGIDPKKYKSRQ